MFDEGTTPTSANARSMLERVWRKTERAMADAGPGGLDTGIAQLPIGHFPIHFRDPISGVFMDELSAVIGNGKLSSRELVRWIEREIASGFNDQFLVEIGSGGHGDDREVQPTGNLVSCLNYSTLLLDFHLI